MTASSLIDCGDGVRLERAVGLRMSDGTTLISDHYYPSNPGPQPTLLMRQPYGRDIASTVVYAHPIWLARHGYNVVIQDVRGRGGSEGSFYPFLHEAQDGFDTIALLCQRPESSGKIGMYGFSYQGMTQWLAASRQPEGLLCIAPAQTAHDLYHGWFYTGGALKLASTLGWGLQMLKEDARRANLREASDHLERAWANLLAQYLETPYIDHPAVQGTYVTDWLEHDQPGKFWAGLDISESIGKVNIPALHIAGWYDTYLAGSIDGFLTASQNAAPEARDHQFLVAGPWQHIPWGDRIGPHSFGPAANLDTNALHLRFFNHYLKGSCEFHAEPRIRHFALNQNQWHTATHWPHDLTSDTLGRPNAELHTLYLRSDSQANSSRGTGILSPEPPITEEPSDIFVYDPEVPVLAPGGIANSPGPTDQASLELGNNLLVYTSSALQAPIHVFGHPYVSLHVITSAPRADLTAKLVLLKPSGEALFLSIGIIRSTHTPDFPHLFRIRMDPTSVVFDTGDRIRLEIASSAFPLFDRNPSTSVPAREASPWNWARSTQTVYHSPAYPSSLHLPMAEE